MEVRVGRILRSRPVIALVSGVTALAIGGGIAYAISNPPAGGVINACAKPGSELHVSSGGTCGSGFNHYSWNTAGSDGYFGSGGFMTVNSNTVVTLVSKTLPPGKYLLTARVDAESYGPNSGVICFFTSPETPNGWDFTTLNTSSDWTNLNTQWTMMLNTYSGNGGTITVACQQGYVFTNSALAKGTLMIERQNSLG